MSRPNHLSELMSFEPFIIKASIPSKSLWIRWALKTSSNGLWTSTMSRSHKCLFLSYWSKFLPDAKSCTRASTLSSWFSNLFKEEIRSCWKLQTLTIKGKNALKLESHKIPIILPSQQKSWKNWSMRWPNIVSRAADCISRSLALWLSHIFSVVWSLSMRAPTIRWR